MSLNLYSAIKYNKDRGYSQQAIGIIQMFANARTTGVFDHQTVEAIYRTQQSPIYPQLKNGADGMVGPSTLGLIILELEHVRRMSEAALLRKYEYRISGITYNSQPNSQNPPKQENGKKETLPAETEPEKIPLEDKDKPRQIYLHELKNMTMQSGTSIPNPFGGQSLFVGNLYLATKDIRKILGGSFQEIIYIVVKTESEALDPFLVGKVYRQTNRGFWSDLNYAWLTDVGRNAKGGMEMAKKQVELMMGAILAGVGAFGGFAALTGAAMNILLNNSEEIFKAARGIQDLIKVKNVLSQHTPEFWTLCKTVLKLSIAKTPETIWADTYGAIRLAGELVMIMGEAVFFKRVRSFGFVAQIAQKLMQGAFGKLTDAATIALAGKDLLKEMREFDPMLDEARAERIIKEIKDNWQVVEPALKTLKAVADQLAGA